MGTLTREEYFTLLTSNFHRKLISKLSVGFSNDVEKMYDWIDIDHEGVLELEEVYDGLDWLTIPISGKSLLQLECLIKKRCGSKEIALIALFNEVNAVRDQEEVKAQGLLRLLNSLRQRCDKNTMEKLAEADALNVEAQRLRKELASIT